MLAAAAEQLAQSPGVTVTHSSPVYETPAAEAAAGQRDFLNAVLRIETTLPPDALLSRAHEIEHGLGRRRTIPGGPRPVDIDLLLYGSLVRRASDPILPHPRMHHRLFVLRPLHDIDPAVRHPVTNQSIDNLLAGLPSAGHLKRVMDAGWHLVNHATSPG
ncbi:MAG: 2-amino-4-hydroxy-6-hydroxymethyldihydropteridine diphosphokinase [Phycisphaerales bacterium]|nr:2-amino-4-hydroxy-6-hydroxymethyldihydropteridine diphosphokinase [Phycisphaerales bacterium]